MKRVLFLVTVVAVMILLFAPAATAQSYSEGGSTASPTAAMSTSSPTSTATASPTAATATASPTATATASPLPRTGGPELLTLPVTLVASLALIASGFVALVLVRRSSASS